MGKCRPAQNMAKVMNVIGEIDGKTSILMDEMIDTTETITQAAEVLKQQEVEQVYACVTHAVLLIGEAIP